MLLPSVSSGRRLSKLFVFECRTFAIFGCARSYVQKLLLLCDEDRYLILSLCRGNLYDHIYKLPCVLARACPRARLVVSS